MTDPNRILIRPLVTEKAMALVETRNTYSFEVAPSANKIDIRKAVEVKWNVKVLRVRTMNRLGKLKRSKNRLGRRKDWKKAYVTLAEGAKLPIL